MQNRLTHTCLQPKREMAGGLLTTWHTHEVKFPSFPQPAVTQKAADFDICLGKFQVTRREGQSFCQMLCPDVLHSVQIEILSWLPWIHQCSFTQQAALRWFSFQIYSKLERPVKLLLLETSHFPSSLPKQCLYHSPASLPPRNILV